MGEETVLEGWGLRLTIRKLQAPALITNSSHEIVCMRMAWQSNPTAVHGRYREPHFPQDGYHGGATTITYPLPRSNKHGRRRHAGPAAAAVSALAEQPESGVVESCAEHGAFAFRVQPPPPVRVLAVVQVPADLPAVLRRQRAVQRPRHVQNRDLQQQQVGETNTAKLA